MRPALAPATAQPLQLLPAPVPATSREKATGPGTSPSGVTVHPFPAQVTSLDAAGHCPSPAWHAGQPQARVQPLRGSRGFSPYGRSRVGWRGARQMRLASVLVGG